MTEIKYDAKALTQVSVNLYHAITGDKPDEKMTARLGAGIEAMVGLIEQDKNLAYSVLQSLAARYDTQLGQEKDGKELHTLKSIFQSYVNALGDKGDQAPTKEDK
jgi:hypothetical protein